MKSERTRDLQVNRVDNEKSNKIAIVQSLPNNGIEGDEIYRGVPPEQVDMGEGFYKRLNGKWIFIGGLAEPVPEEPVSAAPSITFSTQIEEADVNGNTHL
jgi:hypothetical protein